MSQAPGLSRRNLIATGAAAAGAAVLGPGCGSSAKESTVGAQSPHPASPADALAILKAGNERYRSGKLELRDYSPAGEEQASSQSPFAAIITCADSRLSPTLIFDVGHGNLFVSRVAGNTLDVGTLGSTEYAVAKLGVKLIMVLGHSDCGAVKAALGVADGSEHFPPAKYGAIGAFVAPIVRTVNSLPASQRNLPTATLANAKVQAKAFAAKGPVIEPAVKAGKVRVVSGVYDIGSGQVSLAG